MGLGLIKIQGLLGPLGPRYFRVYIAWGKGIIFFSTHPVSRGAEMLQLFAVDMMQKVAASLRRRVGLS